MKTVPIVAADLFRAVMEAATWRCQCAGQCGKSHAKTGGRCEHLHDGYMGKRGGPLRLVAAPADPALPETQAATLPAAALRAWCPQCLHTARHQAASGPVADQGGLFDL